MLTRNQLFDTIKAAMQETYEVNAGASLAASRILAALHEQEDDATYDACGNPRAFLDTFTRDQQRDAIDRSHGISLAALIGRVDAISETLDSYASRNDQRVAGVITKIADVIAYVHSPIFQDRARSEAP